MSLPANGSLSDWLFLCRHRGIGQPGGRTSAMYAGKVERPVANVAPEVPRPQAIHFTADARAQIVPIYTGPSTAPRALEQNSSRPRFIQLGIGPDDEAA